MYDLRKIGRDKYVLSASYLLALLYFLFPLSGTSFGQALDTISTNNIPYELVVPDVILNAGDSVEIRLLLGSSEEPIDQMLSFDLEIKLTDHADFQETLLTSITESWFGNDHAIIENHSLDPHLAKIRLRVSRDPFALRSGAGEVIRLRLYSFSDSVNANDLIQENMGGLIVVDNLEMKQRPIENKSEKDSHIRLFPNPCKNFINITLPNGNHGHLQLFDHRGSIAKEDEVQANQGLRLNTSELPPGIYTAVIRLSYGTITMHKIIVTGP